MSDETRDFEYDCWLKKRIARSASHRKRGSKSKKCSMSTDHMTNKQWKERNGKVIVINQNTLMPWKVFRTLSNTTQEEYLLNLIDNHGATTTRLAEAWGVGAPTIRKHIADNGLNVQFPKGCPKGWREKEVAWAEFLKNSNIDIAVSHDAVVEQSHQCVEEDATEAPYETEEGQEPLTERRPSPKMHMQRVVLNFSGVIDVMSIANSLIQILGQEAQGDVEITCCLQER